MKPHLFSWMNPKLKIDKTTKYGIGDFPSYTKNGKSYSKKTGEGFAVYANKNIKKNEVLFVMGGYILTIEDENHLEGIIADKPIEISSDFSIGPRRPSDLAKMPQHYINHSCDPNAGFKGQIFLVAMKSIKTGDEITYDYAMIMQSNKNSNGKFHFQCVCKTKSCRGTIAEDDWKISNLQSKYNGYFQFFIQEKINLKK